jgi:peptidyl-prolyl cis-trans isomerase C
MRKSGALICSMLFLMVGVASLAGCDLLGLGPKKQDNPKKQTIADASSAGISQNTQKTPGPLPKNVLARVGEWTLTIEELNERLKLLKQGLPDFKENDGNTKKMVIDELIRQQLLVKDAQDSAIGESKEIKDAIEDFRKTLIVQELANRLTKDIVANETDARLWYADNKDKFIQPTTWKVREIVTADEATAKNILVQILQGGDFGQIAQAQSKGKSAAMAGELKPFVTGKAPFEAMQAAIANLEAGGTSSVFKGPQGYYIVKLDSKKGGGTEAFSEVKDKLINGLTMQKQQKVVLEHLNKLAEKYKVEINKELVDTSTGP